MVQFFSKSFKIIVLALFLALPLVVAAQEMGKIDDGDGGFQPIRADEKRDFLNEFRNLQKETNQILKQLTKIKGAEAWQVTLAEIFRAANDCVTSFNQSPADTQRDIMDDCRGQRLWDSMNEIREEFVPPQELNNVFRDIKKQQQELVRYKKQMIKLTGGTGGLEMIEKLQTQLDAHKNSITQTVGREQRDAMQDYWDAQIWDEINKIRAVVELPKEMKNIVRDLKIVQKNVQAKAYQQAFKYFGVNIERLQQALVVKQATIDQINNYVVGGNGEGAFLLLEEDIHQGWHPGDIRHFSDMMRETYQRMKDLDDTEIKDQITSILSSIVDTFNQGDYREAKEAFVQFGDQMQKYERLFQRYYKGNAEFDQKTTSALEKLESLIQEKLQNGEVPSTKQAPKETVQTAPTPALENQPR